MTKLFISPDLGTNSSGNIVSRQELEALESLGEDIIKLGFQDISPTSYGLPDNPFLMDYLTMNKIASFRLKDLRGFKEIDMAHLYASPFTNTIRYLNAIGIKTSLTSAAHDRNESIKEFENLGYQYIFNHIKDDRLWEIYSGAVKEADIVICPSLLSKTYLTSEGVEENRIKIIPHGIEIPHNWEIGNNPNFDVGYMGAIGPDKGLRYLIEAWSLLNYQDSTLIIAGPNSKELEPIIKRYATGGKFHIMGWIENKEDFFKQISIYVQPSVTEAWGMEVVEAMSYGKTVICSIGAGAVDTIEDGVNGFIIKKRDVKGIADKIDWFKKHHQELYIMDGRARSIAEKYDWSIIRKKYTDLWNSLLD